MRAHCRCQRVARSPLLAASTLTCALRRPHAACDSVCTGLEWSRDGSVLAVCQAGSAVVVLWSTEGHRVQYLDTNVKDVSVLSWSRAGRQVRPRRCRAHPPTRPLAARCSLCWPRLVRDGVFHACVYAQLAIGTGKGSLLLYDHDTGVRTMAAAKHKKRVVCADWSDVGNVVAFASEDKQVTVANANARTSATLTSTNTACVRACAGDCVLGSRINDGAGQGQVTSVPNACTSSLCACVCVWCKLRRLGR